MSEAFAAAVGLRRFVGCAPASPISTSWRIASERDAALLRAAHESIALVSSVDKRIAETGSCPVAGRPLFFRTTGIDDFIIYLYYEKVSRARGISSRAVTTLMAPQSLPRSLFFS
jgi:hypothetical protein